MSALVNGSAGHLKYFETGRSQVANNPDSTPGAQHVLHVEEFGEVIVVDLQSRSYHFCSAITSKSSRLDNDGQPFNPNICHERTNRIRFTAHGINSCSLIERICKKERSNFIQHILK